MFPDGTHIDQDNFVLFSTSGVHGSYSTIEDEEKNDSPTVTFVICCPRILRFSYGNCQPRTREDFLYLKMLRTLSHREIAEIGMPK